MGTVCDLEFSDLFNAQFSFLYVSLDTAIVSIEFCRIFFFGVLNTFYLVAIECIVVLGGLGVKPYLG